jgi:hypothetical protein
LAGKRYREAVEHFTEQILLRPTPGAYFNRAIARTHAAVSEPSPDYSGSMEDYRTAIVKAREPGSEPSPNVFGWATLNLIEVYLLAKRHVEAQATAENFLRELDDKNFGRVIARFLLVASLILSGQDHARELDQLRSDLRKVKPEARDRWSFDLLENGVKPAIRSARSGSSWS